ncbi:uncharacterized protein LOC131657589 [Vicia villosa]|uniref:uncharacterized protein LOC131657589 n=1 Tax=Vicia villosa TaxID=3911 RepID=UPI00273C9807|nr:uncharacterized protein LOC131657589 [Vicia villosa]
MASIVSVQVIDSGGTRLVITLIVKLSCWQIAVEKIGRMHVKFAMMVKVIWKNRNNIDWNYVREGISILGLRAYFNWQDWFATQDTHERNNSNQNSFVWSLPAEGVAWNIGSMSSIEAGTLALKEVVQHVVTMNLDYMIFESDSQVFTQGIHSIATDSSKFNFILLSIKRLLAFISNFEVKFIKRQTNMVADPLVKAVNSWSRRSIVNVIPSCTNFHLINDMS